MLARDHALFFSLFSQALFGHFFKGLIDHLVLNHKQLLSVERENHKVNPLLLCALTLFLWLQIFILLQQFACVLFSLTLECRCCNRAASCTRTPRPDTMKRASAIRTLPLESCTPLVVFICILRYFEKLKDICAQVTLCVASIGLSVASHAGFFSLAKLLGSSYQS